MIVKENYHGNICFTENYIKEIVSQAVSECIGVAGLNCTNLREAIFSGIFGIMLPGTGVKVNIADNSVSVSVYISAMYGTNLKTVMRSVKNTVYFALNENAGIPVRSVNVYVSHIKV